MIWIVVMGLYIVVVINDKDENGCILEYLG